jgi:class 3 adenylate cyclase/tetratricopeptide (TPR) repeat protein
MGLHAYLPQDRCAALLAGEELPEVCSGTALFADVSGFTALTEALTAAEGARGGVEALSRRIDAVHDALIVEVERCGGSVVGFAGDGMTAWFGALHDGIPDSARRAARCALAMQAALASFPGLAVKVGLGSGTARRLAVGDPALHLFDLLCGVAVAAAVAAESQAAAGEVRLDAETAGALGLGSDAAGRALEPAAAQGWPPSAVAPASAAAVPPQERLRPFVPPFVLEREAGGQGLFATDLRPATALFVRWDAAHDDPRLAERVAVVQRALHRHGGVLLEAGADGRGPCLYGNFGAAQVHEDDPARALRAALEIQPLLVGTSAQIGLSHGTLRVGGYGGRTRRSFGALGNEVNTAARLMALARPGEILVSGRMRQALAEGAYAFEARPPIAVKGKAEPMPVFAVGAAQQRRAIRLPEPQNLLPLVGRAAETALIAQRLENARRGQGRVLRLVAEAGLGKTRLAAEAVRLARRSGFTGYGGSASADAVARPYRAWHGVWAALFDLDPALPQRRMRAAVQARLAEWAPEQAEAWPLLGAVLDQDWPDTPFTAALAPRDRKALLEALLERVLHACAREAAEDGGGLLLVLEDLHGADLPTLELLSRLAAGIVRQPVLVLCTERPADADPTSTAEVDAPAGGSEAARARLRLLQQSETLVLGPLGPADMEPLVRAKLAQLLPERAGPLPAELLERLAERAQGNPFVVEELLASLHDRGLDPRDPRSLAAMEMPGSLHSLVLSRVDRLSAAQQRTLKAASVLGTAFSLEELHGGCPELGERAAMRAELLALVQAGFVPLQEGASELDDELRCRFRHPVQHEAVYESIAHGSRQRLHAQFAGWLEQQASATEANAAVLAHHWHSAGVAASAAVWCRRAGEQAAGRWAHEQALTWFDRALHWLPAGDAAQRFAVHGLRETVFELQGRHEPQQRELEAMQVLAAVLPPSHRAMARVALRRARRAIAQGDFALALETAREAAAVLTAPSAAAGDDRDELAVQAALIEAEALFDIGDSTAAQAPLARALAGARAGGWTGAELKALSQTGLVHWQRGDFAAARHRLDEALVLAQRGSDVRGQLNVRNNLGVVAKSAGRHREAAEHYAAALELARRIGDRPGEAMLHNNLGSIGLASGRAHEAGMHAEQAARMFAELHEPVLHALALANRAEAHRELGQYAPAVEIGQRALGLLRKGGHRVGEAAVQENLGLARRALGEHDAARGHFQAALKLARETGARSLEASTLLHWGQLEAAADAALAARGMLQEAAGLARELNIATVADAAAVALAQLSQREPLLVDPVAALSATEPLVARLAASVGSSASDDQADAPLGLHVALCRLLHGNGDPRASTAIERTRTRLHEQAARIPDAAARRDFLNIADHRALLDA